MDEMDDAILKILKKDSKRPYVSMAEKLGTSEGTIRTRVKRLVDEGIIKQFTIKVAGKGTKALIDVKVGTNVNTSQVASKIKEIGGVEETYEVSGEEDVVVVIDVMMPSELNDVVEKIRVLENVISTRTRLILKEH